MYARSSVLAAAIGAALLSACSDSTGASGNPQVRFNLATSAAAAGISAARGSGPSLGTAAAPMTLTDGTNTLVLDQVEVVLREIELEREGDDACAQVADDACEKLEIGPILVDLPLTPGAEGQFTVAVDTGHYGEVEFVVHKASPSDDEAFLATRPEFADRSIRVTGSYNGTAFTFYSDIDVEQEIALVPPLVVGESGSADLTLRVDLDRWFRTDAGDLLDPATANKGEPNESQVKNNIQNGFEAFEDSDRDGAED